MNDTQMTPREVGAEAANNCMAKATATGFDADAAKRLILLALQRNGATPGEVLVNLVKAAGHKPHDDRAFGPIFATLARRKLIRCTGFCERRKGHGTAGGRIWATAA